MVRWLLAVVFSVVAVLVKVRKGVKGVSLQADSLRCHVEKACVKVCVVAH